MRILTNFLYITSVLIISSCVDPESIILRGTVDVIVVDGTITNLAEPQLIKLGLSRADPLTGRFGSLPVKKATVEVVVDSNQVVACQETIDGTYKLPNDFRGQIGHTYQLRFTLQDGTRYVSDAQTLPNAVAIGSVDVKFNVGSYTTPFSDGRFRAAHDFFLNTKDPANERNFYRWDWQLYEKQAWCQSCYEGIYAVNNVLYPFGESQYKSGDEPFDNCFFPPLGSGAYKLLTNKKFDYECRSECWEVIQSYTLNLFDDALANGGDITRRKVAQVPFYQNRPALAVIRQSSLTARAYQYFKLFQQQTQNTGGIADSPPTALVGNVRNATDDKENVVGYFAVTAISELRYWLDRADTSGPAPGLFFALNGRDPIPEDPPPFGPNIIIGGPSRPPKAICRLSETKTPFKPVGWRD